MYWGPAVAFVIWLFVPAPAVLLLWGLHLGNPSDDVDWIPLYWPLLATAGWAAVLAAIVLMLRRTSRHV